MSPIVNQLSSLSNMLYLLGRPCCFPLPSNLWESVRRQLVAPRLAWFYKCQKQRVPFCVVASSVFEDTFFTLVRVSIPGRHKVIYTDFVFGKLLEHLIANRLKKQIDERNFSLPRRFDSRQGKSTMTRNTNIITKIRRWAQKNRNIVQ